MERKLILTPTDQAYLYGYQEAENQNTQAKSVPVDITHFFLSAITMSGVDRIYSMLPFEETSTTLIKKIVKKPLIRDWAKYLVQVDETFQKYLPAKVSRKVEKDLFYYKYLTIQLLFAMKSNSCILLISDFNTLKSSSAIPPEIKLLFDVLFSSIQIKEAQLPVVKYDFQKRDVRKLVEILSSKEYNIYKEAQSEIEKNRSLTGRIVKSIEIAGKDLYRKNSKYLTINESLIQAIPMTPQVIELYFGKLPGIIAEFASKIIVDYMGINNTIPIYSAKSISSLLNSNRFKQH